MRIVDGFRNYVAQLGTDRDKASANDYIFTSQNDYQLLAAYRTAGIATRIVDIPAEDSCREWREWQADGSAVTAIEAEERRLALPVRVMDARKRARLYGGAAIYIGTGETNPMKPLDPSRIQRGGLQHIKVLGRNDLTAGPVDRDPTSARYGEPTSWTLRGTTPVHPSRLAFFMGKSVPDDVAGTGQVWGDSALNAVLESVSRLDATASVALALMYEAKVDVFGIPNLSSGLATGGEEFERLLLNRIRLVAQAKGINGAIVKDLDETYEQKSASFGGIPDILDRFMILTSAASGIPVTLLFGRSPAGMNATGEADMRTYYDRVRFIQTMQMEPAMSVLDECLIRSAIGDRPEGIHYNWRSLWQPSAKERAETGQITANALKTAWETGTLSDEAIGDALVNGLTETGAFPGLEAAYRQYGAPEAIEGIEE